MARRSLSLPASEQIHRALQEAPKLQPFIILNVRPTGRELGRGSYGVVEELDMEGVMCAGKKLHDNLIDPENHGVQRMVEKYYRECQILSDLRHPHYCPIFWGGAFFLIHGFPCW